jgi:hypothetical protein
MTLARFRRTIRIHGGLRWEMGTMGRGTVRHPARPLTKETAMSNNGETPARSATDKIALARDHITVGVADAVNDGMAAAKEAKAVLEDKLDSLIDSGKDVIDQAEDLIRTRPWASFGVAFAAGYLIAKLTRGKD